MQKTGNIPDILAYPLEDALSILKEIGFTPIILKTSPPRNQEDNGTLRVVRTRMTCDNILELTVSSENWG